MKHFVRIDLTVEDIKTALLEYCRNVSGSVPNKVELVGVYVVTEGGVLRPMHILEGARVEFDEIIK